MIVDKEATFVLKDNNENYVGVNSISYNKKSKIYDYSHSEFLTNGFYTYQNDKAVLEALGIIQQKGIKIKNVIQFHFEEVNRLKILKEENLKGVPKDPFIHEYYNEEGLRIL